MKTLLLKYAWIVTLLFAAGLAVPDSWASDYSTRAMQGDYRTGGGTSAHQGTVAGNPSCWDYCISHGGLREQCESECGAGGDSFPDVELPHGGSMYLKSAEPRNGMDYGFIPDGAKEATTQENKENNSDFEHVDYGCFRQCRLHGDSFDTCRDMCDTN